MKNSTFSELLWLFWFSVRGCVKHEKTRFVCDIRCFACVYVRCSANTLGKNGKTLRRESAQGGHLFTICARFADVCMVLQNVKGLGLFCGAWQIAGIGYNRRWKGDAATGGWPLGFGNFIERYGSQKPSPCRVAVFAFEFLYPYRDRVAQNMERKHKKHCVTPFRGRD